VVRAVVEGLAFELKRHLLFLERGGIPVQRLVIGGATAASRVTTQIIADVTGLPLACFGLGAGSVLGAAMLARGLVEAGRSLADLSQAMLPVSRVVQPGAEAEFYAGRFQQYAREVVGQ
jgi:L-xylulokinase